MCAHVAKPYDASDLVEVVVRHARPRRHPPEIDLAALRRRYPGRGDFVDRLLAVVVEANGDVPAELRVAADAGDDDALGRLAHKVKGTAGNLVAMPLVELAERVQALAQGGAPNVRQEGRVLAERMERLLEQARQELGRSVSG
jgi:HPt (histidine-containing phosphotransfer) domain-containing protein